MHSFRTTMWTCLAVLVAACTIACSDDPAGTTPPAGTGGAEGGAAGGGGESSGGGGATLAGGVDIVRDEHGVAHVFGETRAAAFYGLGYASAQDRLFQMDQARRFMRGRMAETFGGQGNDAELVNHDLRMRTLGFAAHAQAVLDNPDFPAEIRDLLEAYAAGVNAFVASDGFALPEAFALVDVDTFEPWTAADSLLAWERLRERFNGLHWDEEIDRMLACEAGACKVGCNAPVDDAAGVVPFSDGWPPPAPSASLPSHRELAGPIEFKASHGWAIAGSRSESGKPVLAVDPKLKITAPSFWYNFHLSAPDLDARGIGIAGAPAFLIFWNRHVGQTLTAMGAYDQSDLFEIELSGDGYLVDGVEQPITTHEETILVKGGASVPATIQTTALGPIVTRLVPNAPQGREFAARHVELYQDDSHSLVGAIEMSWADDMESYRSALEKWLSPGVNAVFVSSDADDPDGPGHIGYHVIGGYPLRAANVDDLYDWGGSKPYDGTTSASDWSGMMDATARPHVIDPEDGYLFTANHLPVGSWFDDIAWTGVTNGGDSKRSLRLRYALGEMLADPGAKMSVADVHALHFDAQSQVVLLGRELLSKLQSLGLVAPPLADGVSPANDAERASKTLAVIDAWIAAGGELRDSNPYNPVAADLSINLASKLRQQFYPALACKYNGNEVGISQLLKAFDADPDAVAADTDVQDFAVDIAAAAWTSAGAPKGPTLANWQPGAPTPLGVDYQANQFCPTDLSGNCSLDPSQSFDVPLDGDNGDTILSSLGSSGTGTVDFADVDAAVHMVPMGVSEDPSSPFFLSHYDAWLASDTGDPASILAAPLSRELIEPSASSVLELAYEP